MGFPVITKPAVQLRDQTFLDSFGRTSPILAKDTESLLKGNAGLGRAMQPSPGVASSLQSASHNMGMYIAINPEIWKSYVAAPTNQGQRAAIAARQSMMYDPRNSPSRSQFSQGYTAPIQSFKSNNTWQTPTGSEPSGGLRQRQPSLKAVSPFVSAPIPTRMPWDL